MIIRKNQYNFKNKVTQIFKPIMNYFKLKIKAKETIHNTHLVILFKDKLMNQNQRMLLLLLKDRFNLDWYMLNLKIKNEIGNFIII